MQSQGVVSDRRCIVPTRTYSGSSRDFVRNGAEIFDVFGPHFWKGRTPPNSWPNFMNYSLHQTRHMADMKTPTYIPVSADTSCDFWSSGPQVGIGCWNWLLCKMSLMLSTVCFTCSSRSCEQVMRSFSRGVSGVVCGLLGLNLTANKTLKQNKRGWRFIINLSTASVTG